MKTKLSILIILLWGLNLPAQRIIGYFPNYAYTASYNQIQYSKMTHLYYFSLNPHTAEDGSLWYNDGYSWFNTSNFNNVITAARAANPAIKIFIVTGGAPGSDWNLNTRLYNISTNASKRNKFCNNILNFIKSNNLDGWDLDWEFPTDQPNRDAHEQLLNTMNFKLDSMSTADCRVYQLTAAVGGGYTNRTHYNPVSQDYCNANVINYVDFINIMTYDSPVGGGDGYTSHQQLEAMQNDLTRWVAEKGWPKSKINLGVGFYNNAHGAFSAGGNNNTWYNMNYWPTGGSGCPNMRTKIDYAKAQGCGGIFIWHLMQDNLGAGTTPAMYSLLDCIYQYTTSSWGTWTPPLICTAPVHFLDFDYEKINDRTVLKWTTASEENNDYFIVERSENGIHFDEITKVKGRGNTEELTQYQYTDRSKGTGKLYYRLQQVDVDGTSTYSEIVTVTFSSDLLLYPNPVQGNKFVIRLDEEIVKIKISDVNGRLIIENPEYISGSEIDFPETCEAGVYLVQVMNSSINKTRMLVKE